MSAMQGARSSSTLCDASAMRPPSTGGRFHRGGVGKTSCATSLAVKFANSGHPTLVVSTDPAHSLSDSFDQNLSGGMLVTVEGTDSPLFVLEIDPEQERA